MSGIDIIEAEKWIGIIGFLTAFAFLFGYVGYLFVKLIITILKTK